MKLALTILIILSFAGVAVLGLLAMNYTASSHCYGRCIEAIKIFSASAISLLIVIILIAVIPAVLPPPIKTISCGKIFEPYPCKLKLIHWLALHENSQNAL